ncbi:hypothetical protein [Nonomuraea dietziae]|uniref:hypothetical protein n=1 Tax=Nonomuraea dietziae TaxID=65515 RepID=UPI0031E36264
MSSIASGLAWREGWYSHSASLSGAALAHRCASDRSSGSPAAVTTSACCAFPPGATSQTRPGWTALTAGAISSESRSASPASTIASIPGLACCHHSQNSARPVAGVLGDLFFFVLAPEQSHNPAFSHRAGARLPVLALYGEPLRVHGRGGVVRGPTPAALRAERAPARR